MGVFFLAHPVYIYIYMYKYISMYIYIYFIYIYVYIYFIYIYIYIHTFIQIEFIFIKIINGNFHKLDTNMKESHILDYSNIKMYQNNALFAIIDYLFKGPF